MSRGPVHEAFATQVNASLRAGAIVAKRPPAPIDEVPPDVRPDGPDVVWIPGYWACEEGGEFIWTSGVWRRCPPGQRWVPGYWTQAENGYRWVAGTWVAADAGGIAYLPYPQQASLERGPTSAPPSKDACWVPGEWQYQDARYRWRPGYWSEGRDNWMWMPDHYVWTPRGAVFVQGYWDYPLTDRGLLFAPVRFRAGAAAQAGLRFSPVEVIDTQAMFLHLFERPDYHHYYFGDYYGSQYAGAGIYPWFEFHTAARGYDPLLSYYLWHEGRSGVDLAARLTAWHRVFLDHAEIRPPHTVAALAAFAARTQGNADAKLAVLTRSLSDLVASSTATALPLVKLTEGQLVAVTGTVKQLEGLAARRLELESTVAGVVGSVSSPLNVADVTGSVLQLPRIENPLAVPGIPLPGVGGLPNADIGLLPRVAVPGVATPPLPVPGVGVPAIEGRTGGTVGEAVGGILGGRDEQSGGGVLGGVLGGHDRDDQGDDSDD
jgi:hypothetical protein